MINSNSKLAGVIGGMGPDATVELMRRVIAATPAQDDADHVPMLVHNNPGIPSRIKALLEGGGEDPTPTLVEMAKALQTAGADYLVIPCNTAHHYHPAIEMAVDIPVWHLIRLSLASLKQIHPQAQNVALLASTAVQNIALFEAFFDEAGLTLVYPPADTQQVVMQLIKAVKANKTNAALLAEYNSLLSDMASASKVDVFLLGCSELSVLLAQHQLPRPVLDSLQVLAEAMVAEHRTPIEKEA